MLAWELSTVFQRCAAGDENTNELAKARNIRKRRKLIRRSTNMTYTIERLHDLPVLLGIWRKDFVFGEDGRSYTLAMNSQLNQQDTAVFYILDMSNWHTMTFDELLIAANIGAQGKDANFHHPMNRKTLFVTQNAAVSIAAEGLSGEVFGNVNAAVFSSLDDALAHVRENC
jgi:hypothetical protein